MTTNAAPRAIAAADPFERERAALDALKAFQGDCAEPVLDGYQKDAKGRLVPESAISEHTKLEDQTVRTIAAYFLDLHRQIHRFIGHCYDDLHAFDDLLCEKYGLRRRGGAKGNRTYQSFDGTLKVVVQVQDRITFGPELQGRARSRRAVHLGLGRGRGRRDQGARAARVRRRQAGQREPREGLRAPEPRVRRRALEAGAAGHYRRHPGHRLGELHPVLCASASTVVLDGHHHRHERAAAARAARVMSIDIRDLCPRGFTLFVRDSHSALTIRVRESGARVPHARLRDGQFAEPLRHLSIDVNGGRMPKRQRSRRITRGGRRES